MADRPDIDALLISALYGELTPAEETRLAAHLDSHPADRSLLADLTHARNVVRESRILQVQFEPPQAVSALLLQEAARRAPKAPSEEREGWFARFVRSFAAHPAMAAAAMLVVVIGVATFVTRRKGDHFAESTVPATTAMNESRDRAEGGAPGAQPTPEIASDRGVATGSAAGSAMTEQYPVDLYAADKADGKKDEAAAADNQLQAVAKEAKPEPRQEAEKVAKNYGGTKGGVEVRSAAPQPKELDEAPRKKSAGQAFADEESVALDGNSFKDSSGTATIARRDIGGTGAGAAAPRPTTTASPPPPPPPPPPAAVAASPRGGADAPAADDARAADPALAWAREQHQSVVAQVRAGNCKNAASLAVTLSTRAPSYYSQNVATDRQVKECLAYINTEVTRDAELRASRERARRTEAGSKRAADQPSKPAAKSGAATETTK